MGRSGWSVHSLYLLYWYKSANTDAAVAVAVAVQFTCFTGTKVQILMQLLRLLLQLTLLALLVQKCKY
jgi:hypothetical protein